MTSWLDLEIAGDDVHIMGVYIACLPMQGLANWRFTS